MKDNPLNCTFHLTQMLPLQNKLIEFNRVVSDSNAWERVGVEITLGMVLNSMPTIAEHFYNHSDWLCKLCIIY